MSVLLHILHGKQWRDFTHRVAIRRHQTALEAPRSGHLAWIVTKSDTSLSLIKIKDSAWRRSEYSGESFSILWWDQWNGRYNAISRVKTTSILTALYFVRWLYIFFMHKNFKWSLSTVCANNTSPAGLDAGTCTYIALICSVYSICVNTLTTLSRITPSCYQLEVFLIYNKGKKLCNLLQLLKDSYHYFLMSIIKFEQANILFLFIYFCIKSI